MEYKVTRKNITKPLELSNGSISMNGYFEVIVEGEGKYTQRYFPKNISEREVEEFIRLSKRKLYGRITN